MPLRLLSNPITATRSAIGVVPSGSGADDCRTGSALGCSCASLLPGASPRHAKSASVPAAMQIAAGQRTYSGVQAW